MSDLLITIEVAEKRKFCNRCNFAGRLARQAKPCNYHTFGESLNYRKIPAGMCALRLEDRNRMKSDYGTRKGVLR